MRLALPLALLAAPLSAEELTPAETGVLPRLIDSLCLDLVPDRTGCETALLLASEDDPLDVDLVILSDRRDGPVETLAVARSIAWDGPLWGQAPGLERIDTGPDRPDSLALASENIGVSRSAWSQRLTIAHRDGAFVVAGYTYSTRDRLNTAYGTCDVNLLSGDWEIETGIGARDDPPEMARGKGARDLRGVGEWAETVGTGGGPEVCDAMFARLRELSEVEAPE
ncbi:hypothetical protein [Jannaschia marina]|uniref:hypothetical protein n=1 Tax=Jannaschia marina TaxID=2741674 RepID=UPI0015C9260A|nr:hypothetical protein [Jannaschia marina]